MPAAQGKTPSGSGRQDRVVLGKCAERIQEVARLVESFPELAGGKDDEALGILQMDRLPLYAQESKWLLQRGYAARIDIPAGWIHWEKQQI